MAKQEFSLPALAAQIPTEHDAYVMLERLRWNGTPVCPHCGLIGKAYYLKPANGTSRATRTGSRSQRRVWKCAGCRKQFTVLVGTIFESTKIPVRTWLLVIFDLCAAKNGMSAREVERKYGVTGKTAWFMIHRIREAMKREPLSGLLTGLVQADETFIGGDPHNRHKGDPREPRRAYATSDKQPVMALVHYETREARSRVVPNVTSQTLLPALREEADLSETFLHTDGAKAYLTIAAHTKGHEWVSHEAGEYVNPRTKASTNLVEGFFSQLKRSLDGTHHHVSVEHLPRYLVQFDWLYTYCRWTDSDRMRLLLDQVAGRRLTYKPLTGRA